MNQTSWHHTSCKRKLTTVVASCDCQNAQVTVLSEVWFWTLCRQKFWRWWLLQLIPGYCSRICMDRLRGGRKKKWQAIHWIIEVFVVHLKLLYDPLNSCSISFFPSRAETHHAHPQYFSRVKKDADIGNIFPGKVDWVQWEEEPFTLFNDTYITLCHIGWMVGQLWMTNWDVEGNNCDLL
jgi:hypothetical protein